MLLNCGAREDSRESFGQQGDQTSDSQRKLTPNSHWKDWCWSWNFNNLATWCEEVTHWKRPWCWERLKARGEGDDRGWDGWMASPTQWTWVWATPGEGEGQGNLVCCSPWCRTESGMTEQLNNKLNRMVLLKYFWNFFKNLWDQLHRYVWAHKLSEKIYIIIYFVVTAFWAQLSKKICLIFLFPS